MNKLLQLLESNRARALAGPRLVMGYFDDYEDAPADKNLQRVEGSDEATLFVYDTIGGWFGVDGGALAKEIAALDVKTIHLRINSPGGDVFDARVLKTALEQSSAKVIAHVDGLAASAASFLMLAADEIEISAGAFVMIHNPWTVALGGSKDMRATADMLDKIGASIANDYAAKGNKSVEEFQALMDAETWLEASEALAHGLVDRIAEKATKAQASADRFDLSAFERAPAALVAPPAPPAPQPDAFDALERQHAIACRRLALIKNSAA